MAMRPLRGMRSRPAAAAALVATAIMHLLLIATPRPQMFFTWIIGLATVIAVVYPFSTTAPLSQRRRPPRSSTWCSARPSGR